MHEFPLGIVKDTFKHKLRILHALGGSRIQRLNERYVRRWRDGGANVKILTDFGSFRVVPTFGDGEIRSFSKNVSNLQKMTAARYEDILLVRSKP